jgi:hypothetical protein
MIKKLIEFIKVKLAERRKKAAFKKALDKYKQQDPFNYKNF